MRKMPALFVREFVNNRIANITETVTPGCEWVLAGEGTAYIKRDGTSCAVIGGVLNPPARAFHSLAYDAKRGKTPPPDAIPCDPAPDPVTGHWPHWLPVRMDDPQAKWHMAAWMAASTWVEANEAIDGTYELCGPHFQANPERLERDTFIKHDSERIIHPWANELIAFDALRKMMFVWEHEGLVFHHPDGRMAKIRRADFGFEWPIKGES